MGSIKVTLVKSLSGHPARHRETLRGLGLTRLGMSRLVPDNSATRGMVSQVSYLIDISITELPFVKFGKRGDISPL